VIDIFGFNTGRRKRVERKTVVNIYEIRR